MAYQDVKVVTLNSLVNHPVAHLVVSEPLLPSELVAKNLCEPLESDLGGEPVSPWLVFVEDLGKHGGGRIHSLGIRVSSLFIISSEFDDSTTTCLVEV